MEDGAYAVAYDHTIGEPRGYVNVISGTNLNKESSNHGSRHTEESNKPNGVGASKQRMPVCLSLIALLFTITNLVVLVIVILIFKGMFLK